jgi:hypothetical protein
MRHRAPRRLFALLHPYRLMRARPRLARLTSRPTLRFAGGLAMMLLMATAAVVTAETLRSGVGAAGDEQPTSEGRLPSGPRTSRADERAPLPTTSPTGHADPDAGDADRRPASTPASAPASTPAPEPSSLLPTTPAQLSASLPASPGAALPDTGGSPTVEPSSPTGPDHDDSSGGDGSGDGTPEPRGDEDPPDTTLLSGPPLAHVASFVFESDEGGTFQCSLDGRAFRGCDSPQLYTDLDPGWHTFRVRAVDVAGNADPSPATRRWHSSAPGSSGPKPHGASRLLD